jgi:phenylalanyl-tRNA synthetase beta chain
LKTQEDLIEEIGRIWGYEKIEPKPLFESVLPAKANEILSLERKIQEKLAYLGFDEMYNYSFYSQVDAKNCGLDGVKHYELANAMSPEQDLVRVSLIPNILKNVRENLKHFDALNIFEIGRAYFPNNDAVEEKRMLVMAQVLGKDQHAETFYNLKNSLENLLESFGIENVRFVVPTSKLEALVHKERCAEIEIGKEKIGMIGEISPVVLGKYKIEKRVAMMDIDLEKMLKIIPREKNYKSISKFPEVVRDISMIVPENVSYFEIEKNILQSGEELIENVSLFDYFPAKNSLAVRISMNGKTRTLESKEVDEVMEKIVLNLEKELNIEIRK